jgi:hypothetical protein
MWRCVFLIWRKTGGWSGTITFPAGAAGISESSVLPYCFEYESFPWLSNRFRNDCVFVLAGVALGGEPLLIDENFDVQKFAASDTPGGYETADLGVKASRAYKVTGPNGTKIRAILDEMGSCWRGEKGK